MARERELIEPNEGDKRFVRRDDEGRFTEQDDVSRSLSQDQKRKAKTVSKKGQGDKGDRKRKWSSNDGAPDAASLHPARAFSSDQATATESPPAS